jgi:hypothetical protein
MPVDGYSLELSSPLLGMAIDRTLIASRDETIATLPRPFLSLRNGSTGNTVPGSGVHFTTSSNIRQNSAALEGRVSVHEFL